MRLKEATMQRFKEATKKSLANHRVHWRGANDELGVSVKHRSKKPAAKGKSLANQRLLWRGVNDALGVSVPGSCKHSPAESERQRLKDTTL